jgi:vanillate O-demethylase ferredoxin subunit
MTIYWPACHFRQNSLPEKMRASFDKCEEPSVPPTTTQQQNIQLAARRLRWDFSATPAITVPDDAELTAFMLAVSHFVVAFEDVGIPIVRNALPQLKAHTELAREAKTFVSQEALHSQAHALYNAEIKNRHGFDVTNVERECQRMIDEVNRQDAQWQLAAIAGLEHAIFCVADWYEHADWLHPNVAPEFHRLLLWHAMEETEHTAVVHDMYGCIYGSSAGAYAKRIAAMTGGIRLTTRTLIRLWREFIPQVAQRMNKSPDMRRSWRAFSRTSLPYLGDVLSFYTPGYSPAKRNPPTELLAKLRGHLAPLGAPGLSEMQVTAVTEVAAGVRSYRLELPDGNLLPEWTAGSHVDVEIEPGVIRQYSLCNDPVDRSHYLITVKREVLGRGGSLRLHQEITRGSTLRIGLPRNNFVRRADNAPLAIETVLIAGGIGITPLLAMAHDLFRKGGEFKLHALARDESALPFGENLADLAFAQRLSKHFSKSDHSGRVDLAALIPSWNAEIARELFVCGSEKLVNDVRDAARAAGWPEFAVFVEQFASTTVRPETNQAFSLTLLRSGVTLTVEADQTALEAMELHGLKPVSACREGICGACICKTTSREVDHRDAVLSHIEQSEGQITPCVSRAKGDHLTLDL